MPLGSIKAEITSIEKMPRNTRTVADAERLADLREAATDHAWRAT